MDGQRKQSHLSATDQRCSCTYTQIKTFMLDGTTLAQKSFDFHAWYTCKLMSRMLVLRVIQCVNITLGSAVSSTTGRH